jgi:TIR domain
MRLYVAYASENAAVAEQIYLALIGDGHDVFFDRPSLLPGDDYDKRFREAIAAADALIFLISPSSIKADCYALTELHYAKQRWPHPRDRVLPVLVERTILDNVPAYLRAVTILEPQGNIAAEVAHAVRQRRVKTGQSASASWSERFRDIAIIGLCSLLTAIAIGTIFSFVYPHVEIDLSLVLLALIVALSVVLIARTVWRALR